MQTLDSVRSTLDSLAADTLAQPEAQTVGQVLGEAVAQVGDGAARVERAEQILRAGLDSLNEAGAPGLAPGDSLAGGAWERLVEGVSGVTGLGRVIAADVLLSLALILALTLLRSLVLMAVRARSDDPRAAYRWRKATTYAAVLIGGAVMLRIWLGALGSFVTFLGLLSAGVAIALREPLVNLAAWFFILWRRPFAPGDRISLRTHVGDVIDQRVLQFTLLEVGTATGAMQSTGRIVHIPNGWVFTDSIINHTSSFAYIWHEIPVTVTFESDWRAAKATLLEIAHACADHFSEDAARRLRRAAREYFIYYTTLTPTVYTSVLPHGVQLTIRYLVDPRRVRNSEESIWEAVLDAFVPRDDITLAYPTSRIFRSSEETMHNGPLPHVAPTHFEAPRGGGARTHPPDPLPESRGSGT